MADLTEFFSIDRFMPHGHCYLWTPSILWLNVISDMFILLAYVSIPITLLYIIRKRRDLPFSWVFVAFGAFIVSCGISHLMEVITVWIPVYAIEGLVKLFTALVSLLTAWLLMRLVPLILALPSPLQLRFANDQLTESNQQLHREIFAHKQAQEQLKIAYDKMSALNQQLVLAAETSARVEALEKSERRFMQVVEAAPHGEIVINHKGEIELVNKQIEKIFGYSKAELNGKSVEILIPERFRQHHPLFRQDYFRMPEAKAMGAGRDLFGLRKDGTEVPLEIGLNPINFDDGMKVLCGVIDITERKNLEAQFRLVVEAAPNAMLMVNDQGVIELINKETETLFGYLRSELLGKPIEILIPERFRYHHPDSRQAFFRNSEARAMGVGRDLYGLRQDGSEFPIEIGLRPIETSTGLKVLSSIIDISTRKFFTDELARSNKELENFAYVASHDLKSPLRGVDQLATWLTEDLEGKIDESAVEHLRLMRVRINRMERLLDDLLTYSRAGKKDKNLRLTNTRDLVSGVFDLSNTHRTFHLNLNGEFPEFMTASVPLEQVFRNLISNAIKHHGSSSGEISVSVSTKGKFYVFEVADDGQGIPLKQTEQAFAMFQTLRPRDEVEGSGMGLAIVKKIIESFGGDITLSKNIPKGARFSFTWPI